MLSDIQMDSEGFLLFLILIRKIESHGTQGFFNN